MGKKPSSRARQNTRRKPVDRRPGGKIVKKETTGRAPRARQGSGSARTPRTAGTARPDREARSSGPDRTSMSRGLPRARQGSGSARTPRTAGTARPDREARSSGPDRTSTSREPPRAETDDHAGREEREFHDDREAGSREREAGYTSSKGADRERESHWIEFASKEQKDVVHEEVNMFGEGDEPWEMLVVKGDTNMFFYQKGTFTSIYLMPRDAKDRFKGLMGNPGLKHFGLFLGMFHGTFNLSLEGASELARRGGLRRNWIKLSDEGEKSFLYGQDIKKPMLQEVCPRGITHDRGICIVLNARGECIGIGKLEARDPRLVRVADDEIIIKNVVDRGVYLRDQDRYA